MKNPNELSATSSWRGNELQLIEQKANIVVGVANSRTRLRIGVLLSKYSEYQVDYISSDCLFSAGRWTGIGANF